MMGSASRSSDSPAKEDSRRKTSKAQTVLVVFSLSYSEEPTKGEVKSGKIWLDLLCHTYLPFSDVWGGGVGGEWCFGTKAPQIY